MKYVNDYKNPIKKSQNEMKGILVKWNERNPIKKSQNEMKGILVKWNERNPREIPE